MLKRKSPYKKDSNAVAIGLCGAMYSGKDTIADYIVFKYGFKKFSYSADVLKPIISLCQGNETRDVYIRLGVSLDKVFGEYCLDSLLHRRISLDGGKKVIIPNIRLLNNVNYWKYESRFRFHLILVMAKQNVRLDRWRKMPAEKPLHEYDRNIKNERDFETLNRKDLKETDLSKLLRTRESDFTIVNNSGLSDLYARIDAIMDYLKEKPLCEY
jgi:dephospho-CoA kinase